jgi:hypothetical protein
VSDALESKRDECDIEDLFNRDTFLQLVDESYDLSQALLLNEKIPRIVKQIENSFSTDKKHFVKAKPARIHEPSERRRYSTAVHRRTGSV